LLCEINAAASGFLLEENNRTKAVNRIIALTMRNFIELQI